MAELAAAVGTANAAAAAADNVVRWYREAKKAAVTQEARDAAALAYFGALLASSVASLDVEFRALTNEVEKLDASWSAKRRGVLADQVRALADKEELVQRLEAATDFLRKRAHEPGWREKILPRGKGDRDLDDALDELLSVGEEVLRCVGARDKGPTPAGIEDVERKIRSATDESEVEQAKSWAREVLAAIDRMTVRAAHRAFGGFASVLSKKHGISAPDWATLF